LPKRSGKLLKIKQLRTAMETTSIARKKGAEINETFQGKWPLLNVFVQLRRGILATRIILLP
jgi:hypothetical protein